MKKRKRSALAWIVSMLLGFVCAVVLGAVFYGTMVYQLAGESGAQRQNLSGVLALDAVPEKEETLEEIFGGEVCSVVKRTYVLDGGLHVQAVTASPAIYFERIAQEGFVPQLVTGFSLAGMDAILQRNGETGLLAAGNGERAYLLIADADDQTLYALGAGALLEE